MSCSPARNKERGMSLKEWKPNKPSLEQCRNVLKQLVQVNTCQPEGNEADIIAVIQKLLPSTVSCTYIGHGSNRASLIAQIKGEAKSGGIALIGHVDTVACSDLKQWKYAPHDAVAEGDVLWGRGAADMKGGVAAMILSLCQIAGCGQKPSKPLYFCFTADEENGGMGISSMVNGGYLDGAEEVIICEPSDEKVGTCEKGALWLSLHVLGVASHASRPDLGLNAAEYAICFAQQMKQRTKGHEHHEILGETTVSVTRLQGGIMTNIIPSDAHIELDIRTVPGVSHEALVREAEEICKEMQAGHPGLHTKLQVLNDRPALESDKDCRFVRDILEGAKRAGIGTGAKGHYFYTDASLMIPHIHVPFVIAGPGDDAMAHCVNERISLGSVARYTQLYSDYLMEHYILNH